MTDRPVEPFHPLDPNKSHNQPIFRKINHLQHILPGEYRTPIFASTAARRWRLPQHRSTFSACITLHFPLFTLPFAIIIFHFALFNLHFEIIYSRSHDLRLTVFIPLRLFCSTATPQHYYCLDGGTFWVVAAAPHHVLEVTAALFQPSSLCTFQFAICNMNTFF